MPDKISYNNPYGYNDGDPKPDKTTPKIGYIENVNAESIFLGFGLLGEDGASGNMGAEGLGHLSVVPALMGKNASPEPIGTTLFDTVLDLAKEDKLPSDYWDTKSLSFDFRNHFCLKNIYSIMERKKVSIEDTKALLRKGLTPGMPEKFYEEHLTPETIFIPSREMALQIKKIIEADTPKTECRCCPKAKAGKK